MIKIGLLEEPKTLNIWLASDRWSKKVLRGIYQPLYIREPNNLELIPWLAESKPLYDPESVSYIVRLRAAKWSDGSEFTAEDVVFTGNLIKDFKVPRNYSKWKFIKKILTRPLNLRRANIFTLNYDTLIEQACDAEGAVLVDGFVGTLRRVFRPESYDIDFYFPAQTTEGRVHRFDRALHLYKLHGSITWHRCDQDWDNPFGLYATFYDQNTRKDDVLIYPSPLKYGQTLGMPYSELFRRFGNAIAQPQSALFVIGYGFGDDHVNALIRQALAIPSFTLVVVDPEPKSDFVAELEKLEDERVWIVKGWELGTFDSFVAKLLPDLREEEIDTKVMKTFKGLAMLSRQDTGATEEDSDG
jgi:hypothetical protein